MITCSSVCFGYGTPGKKNYRELIHEISLSVDDGEFIAVTGENGAGKSTFSKLLAGLLKPTQGTVVVNGMNTAHAKNSALAAKIGYLFQNPDRQLCCYTVRDEIAFGLKALSCGTAEQIAERAEEMVHTFHFNGDEPPFALSRGQRQRLALASVIAVQPEIMILDEPTTGLDYKECMEIMNAVRELNKHGTTVIMICHDMELVLDFARRMIVFAAGRIVADGPVQTIMQNTAQLEQASLLPPQIIQVGLELKKMYAAHIPGFIVQATAESLADEIEMCRTAHEAQ